MKKLKRLALLLVINAAILVPVIYGFEFFLERRDPSKSLPANGMAKGKLITWGHPVENNRFGYLERDFAAPKPPGWFRIAIPGASPTSGAGLTHDGGYSNLREKSL